MKLWSIERLGPWYKIAFQIASKVGITRENVLGELLYMQSLMQCEEDKSLRWRGDPLWNESFDYGRVVVSNEGSAAYGRYCLVIRGNWFWMVAVWLMEVGFSDGMVIRVCVYLFVVCVYLCAVCVSCVCIGVWCGCRVCVSVCSVCVVCVVCVCVCVCGLCVYRCVVCVCRLCVSVCGVVSCVCICVCFCVLVSLCVRTCALTWRLFIT